MTILAAKLDPQTLIMLGMIVTVVVSLITFSNWRLGVKIAFVMVLFEGAIRKWVIPGAQELAYFAKDVFLVGAYLRFFFFPDPELRAWKLRIPGGLFMMLCMIVSFSTLNPNIGSPVLAAYGYKIYVFYLPLGFMVPYLFRSREDLAKNIFWYAMLAMPICLLGVVQYARPGDSFLNVMATGEAGTSMGWQDARIRVTGTFSYITGHTTFVVVFFCLHLALLMNKMPKWQWVCLMANMPLLAGNALMSGSRSTVGLLVFIGVAFLVAGMFGKVGTGDNAVLKIGAAGMIVMGFLSMLFGEAREQFMARAKSSGDSAVFRIVEMPVKATGMAMKHGGLFGYGIGMTHPAPERMRSALKIPRPRNIAPTFDVEVAQVLVELGVIGWIAWYGLRVLVLLLTFAAFRECPPGLTRSLVVASIVIQMPHMLLGMVLNHTANFLVFGFFGLAMIPMLKPAIVRRGQARNAQPAAPALEAPAALPAPAMRGSKFAHSRTRGAS